MITAGLSAMQSQVNKAAVDHHVEEGDEAHKQLEEEMKRCK